jgi:PKD repeat protein
MKKAIPTLFLIFWSSALSLGQCVIEPFLLEKRNNMSEIVVEGRVTNKVSKWTSGKDFIYTINTVEVFKIFKGQLTSSIIEIITEGGQVDLSMIKADPSLELQIGELGVFFLNKSRLFLLNETSITQRYLPVASVQSFVKYDQDLQTAHDYMEVFPSITGAFYSRLTELNGHSFINMKDIELDPWKGKIRPLATPVINNFDWDTATAGTETLLTITGSNFGFGRGTGGVYFVDADYGDGRTIAPEFSFNYKSWSNSKIEVLIPASAGSGKIKVINAGNESGTSSKTLFIKYAQLNATYGSSTLDTQDFMVDHINDNGKGGYTWNMNTKFRAKPLAVNAFLRSLESWRCGTLINFEIGNDTLKDTILRDGVNLVRFTKFGDGRLGVCYSFYSGCFDGTRWNWYVNELDIQFDSLRNWYYGTSLPGGSQIDFQSVVTHELGHGHQLGHVIDNTKIMHYSIGSGQRKVNLSAYDREGGIYIMSQSIKTNSCGPARMTAILQNKCTITKPTANFGISKTTVCPGTDITVTDSSVGVINTYSWDFGAGASPSNAAGVGPHTFKYTTPGIKTVSLISSNDFGQDTLKLAITVNPPAPVIPVAEAFADSVCIGQHKYRIARIADAASYLWSLPAGGGSIVGTNTDTIVTINWTGAGVNNLNVWALNSCGSSPGLNFKLNISKLAKVGFTQVMDGRRVTFTNTSIDADTFNWIFGDGDSSNQKDPIHEYANAKSYSVKLIAANYCSSEEITISLKVVNGAGVSTFNKAGKFLVYPNPVNDVAILKLEGLTGQNFSVRIEEVTGKVLMSQTVNPANETRVSLFSLASGLYTIELIQDGKVIGSQKLIKE